MIATSTCTIANAATGTFTMIIDSTPKIIASGIQSISGNVPKAFEYTAVSYSSGTLTGSITLASSTTAAVIVLVGSTDIDVDENDIQILTAIIASGAATQGYRKI